jgi:hypothetical protein
MIRYIIEKTVNNGYAHGVQVLTDNSGNPRGFTSETEAKQWLIDNDKESIDCCTIKPYVI